MSHRVIPGDRSLPAAALNDAFRASEIVLSGGGKSPRPARDGVLVKNSSGSAVGRYGVLGIDGVLVDHSTKASTFLASVNLDGNTPAATHRGNFAVCLEPIKAGRMGRCVVAGLVQVQVDVIDELHAYADIKASDATMLQSHSGGSARIVWKESGTGTKWAVVALGEAGGAVRLRVHTEANDYLVCHSWDGTTEGTDAINVAKPWKLRHDADNYEDVTSLSTTSASEVDVDDGGGGEDAETWVVTPSYQADDEIYALRVPGTGVTVSSVELGLVDLNIDGRAWAKVD